MKRIYTVGHSTRRLWEFIRLLKMYRIALVIDVRRFPTSTRNPQFKREVLEQALPAHGIRYEWLGDLLGGYRPGGYENYMESEWFWKGIRKLLELVEQEPGRSAIMCSEKLWFKCHRQFISDALTSMGYEVIHIIEPGRTQRHPSEKRPKSMQLPV